MAAEAEDVGGRMEPAELDKLDDGLFAQALDVERSAADEMLEALDPLRRADQAAGAADVDLALLGDRLAPALGAMVGEDIGRALLAAGQILDHLRDDVAGALDLDPVADAQAEPGDLVAVVQGDVGDDHPADADRLQPSDRGQLAGPADLDVDRLERGLGALGGEFVGHPPARRAADRPEPVLPVEPIDLIDDPVDVVGKVRPRRLDARILIEHLVDRFAAGHQLADREAQAVDRLHRGKVKRSERLAHLAPAVRVEAQRPRRGDTRILLAKRAGRGVARVGENLAAGRLLPLVQRLEVGLGHVDFAADLEDVGRALQLLRDVADGADVRSHVFPDLPVATGGRKHQLPALDSAASRTGRRSSARR